MFSMVSRVISNVSPHVWFKPHCIIAILLESYGFHLLILHRVLESYPYAENVTLIFQGFHETYLCDDNVVLFPPMNFLI